MRTGRRWSLADPDVPAPDERQRPGIGNGRRRRRLTPTIHVMMSAHTEGGAAALPKPEPPDWRCELDERRRGHLRKWLWSGAGLTFLILVIGGLTRLTQSGLSIVDWSPIMGIVPPLSEADWEEAFARYRQFPEYQLLRPDMTLGEFRVIYLWEYVHRLFARLIGLVFLIPFLFFLTLGYLNRPLRVRALALFGLGALQGFMGWYMVSSGLLDDPRVSHYRLAAHLSIALCILGLCLWMVRELSVGPAAERHRSAPSGTAGVLAVGGLLLLQILWGAFVAGLDAGLYYNTFPLMGGRLLPPGGAMLDPLVLNPLENPIAVQWVHRMLGTVLVLAAGWVHLAARRRGGDVGQLRLSFAFLGLVLLQYGIGVLTLLLHVPVSLGALHQALAVVVFGVWVVWLHRARLLTRVPARV
jgi:cytochrome c oxidase assembly protein subunit 15